MKRVTLIALQLSVMVFMLLAGHQALLAGDDKREDVMDHKDHKKHKTIKYSKVLSLSHTITPTIPLWPGDPPVEFETVATIEQNGYFLRRFSMGEHSATHMNAPNTFFLQGRSIDEYSPESLIAPAVVIDVTAQVARNNDYVISVADVMAWERQHGAIRAGSLVLFYTGFQNYWNDPARFFNMDANGGLHFPGVGGDTTAYLLRERRIAGVGIDTHGVDPGQDQLFGTNTQVLANNGIILECLNNLDRLPPEGTTVIIGALALKGGSGSPVAVFALAP